MSEQPRGDKRYPLGQSLKVRCPSWRDFANLYAADVSQGGMFIQTDSPPELLSELEIELALPEGHTIQLKARVVHLITAEQAAIDGHLAGVGVQFVELDLARKRQIQQLVDFSRWEGGTENRPSLAAALSEMTVSLPPSAVLRALPDAARRPSQAVTTRPGEDALDIATAAATASRAKRRADSGELKPGRTPRPKAPKPANPQKLKLGLTQLAHKTFEQAIKTFEELVQESPTSPEARQWLGVARARLCLKQDDEDGAATHYQNVLDIDEHNHEARKFVREHHTNKRLNAIPFGRYFTKKT